MLSSVHWRLLGFSVTLVIHSYMFYDVLVRLAVTTRDPIVADFATLQGRFITIWTYLLFWLLLPCVVLACVHACFWWYGRRARRMLKGLPCYPTLPFIGNLHQVLGDSKHLVQVMKDTSKIVEDGGLPFACWIGPLPVIIVQDPDDVKAVTNTFAAKPYYYSFAREWVGNGLVTAPVYIWKRSIKKLAGTFTGSIVDGYQEIFNGQAQKLVGKLKNEAGEPFDAMSYLAFTTLESICQTALGDPRISESIVTQDYYRAFTRTFELLVERATNIFYHLDWVYRLTPTHKELVKNIAVMHNLSETVIRKRIKEREELKRNGTTRPKDQENGKLNFKSFLDLLLDLGEIDPSLDTTQIRNEVDTIIVGGQETVAITLFFTLLVFGTKTDIQEKVYSEMQEIFGDSKRPVEKTDQARMVYTEAVIHETLRLYPPVPFVMRDSDRDLQIKSCTIPKGTKCGVNVWGAGHSRRVWGADAEEYRPERWLEGENLARLNSASFLAFSYGKRACIGRRYAMSILKTLIAHIIRELKVHSTLDKLQMKIDGTLKPASGHLMTFKMRGNAK